MIRYRRMRSSDHKDVKEMCERVWDGADYLPELFNKWIDNEGYFMAAVDEEKNKVVGAGKYSIFPDGTGWLEGLRVHEDYRGLKISNSITDLLLEIARTDLEAGRLLRIGYSTHASSNISIHLMEDRSFKLKQSHITVFKNYDAMEDGLKIGDFEVKEWDISFEEFKELPYIKRRDNILPIAFIFQRPTFELYSLLKEEGCFVEISGHRGIYKYKGEPNFIAVEESLEAIEAFANYYGLFNKSNIKFPSLTTILKEDVELIEGLKQRNYSVWCDWSPDYFYFEYER